MCAGTVWQTDLGIDRSNIVSGKRARKVVKYADSDDDDDDDDDDD